MALKSVSEMLWVVGIACQAILALVFLYRKVWKTYPFFALYFAIGFAEGVFLYAFQQHKATYFYLYWFMEAVGVVLGFAVVYELFSNLFAAHIGLRKLATVIFRCVLVLLLCIGIVVLVKHSPLDLKGLTSAVVVVEEAARIIEIGMLMCLFVLSSAFGLHWRQQVFGIALGLGIYVTVELVTVTVWGLTGKAAHDALNVVRVLGFNTSLLIWIGYLLVPERAASRVELPEQSQLEQWNQAVMELIRQ